MLQATDKRKSITSAVLWPLALVVAVWVVFGQAVSFNYVNWDDPLFVPQNPLVTGRIEHPILKAWTTFEASYYAPTLWMVFRAVHSVFGPHPAAYHALSILLHSLNAVMVLWLLRRLGAVRASFAGALIWALHPLRVESVAWVTETKDTLSGFCCLGSALLLIDCYRGASGWRAVFRRRGYYVALVLFILGLGAKATVVIWPASLLLALFAMPYLRGKGADATSAGALFEVSEGMHWREHCRRLWRLCIPLIPLVVFSCVFAWLHFLAQTEIGVAERHFLRKPHVNLLLASASVFFHLWKLVLPIDLCPFYVRPMPVSLNVIPYQVSVAATLLVLAAIPLMMRRLRWLSFGLAFHLVTMLPMLQIVPTVRPLADRYTYLSSIVLCACVALCIRRVFGKSEDRRGLREMIPILIVVACEAWLAVGALQMWRNPEALWERIYKWHRPPAPGGHLSFWKTAAARRNIVLNAHVNYGRALIDAGKLKEAENIYREALVETDDYMPLYLGLGHVLIEQRRYREAEEVLAYADNRWPDNPKIGFQQVRLYLSMRDVGNAERVLPKALATAGWNPRIFSDFGTVFMRLERPQTAAVCFERCTQDSPLNPLYWRQLGIALASSGRMPEARTALQRCLKLDPSDTEAARLLQTLR